MHPRPSDVDHPRAAERTFAERTDGSRTYPLQSQVHAVEKLMTVTGTVASSNAPPDEPDDVDVNPARVRHEKDPVNLEQTAFVSSLVGTATGGGDDGDGAGRGPPRRHERRGRRCRRGRNEHRDGRG